MPYEQFKGSGETTGLAKEDAMKELRKRARPGCYHIEDIDYVYLPPASPIHQFFHGDRGKYIATIEAYIFEDWV